MPYWWLDLGAAVQNLLLLATEAGLAAGFLRAHAVEGLSTCSTSPTACTPPGWVTLGHRSDDESSPTTSERRGRRNRFAVVHDDRRTDPIEATEPTEPLDLT